MNRRRLIFGVGARLGLALALIVALALGVAWAIVVPSLERNLTETKLTQIEGRAQALTTSEEFPLFYVGREGFGFEFQEYANLASGVSNSRVVVYEVLARQPGLALRVMGDSRQDAASTDVADDPIARQALMSGSSARGVVRRDGQSHAEVAVPIEGTAFGVLFTSPLSDTLSNVRQVKQRLLVAGGAALGLAVLLGYAGASFFARRLRRLERAADRIAGGRLDEPVHDRGRDEVGQLAEAFERMRRRLARVEHARREFIANASHELRTPIFSLGGFLELLAAEDLEDETRREFLGTMQEQVRRLERLATDLLDLSRLDAGQLTLEVERIELPAVAGALATEFAAVARAAGHDLDVEADGVSREALGDPVRTFQIGRALVENALRHTPEGTHVRIRVGDAGDHVAVSVEDDGPGIPAEYAGQVFERFFRIEGPYASGSGLGLAIARELAGAMGGTLELDARPGRTVFRLTLPAAAVSPERPRQPVLS